MLQSFYVQVSNDKTITSGIDQNLEEQQGGSSKGVITKWKHWKNTLLSFK